MTTAASKEKTSTEDSSKNVDRLRDSAVDLTEETSNLFKAFIEANAELQKTVIKTLSALFNDARDTLTSAREDAEDTRSGKSGGKGVSTSLSDAVGTYNRTVTNLAQNVADFVQDTAKGMQKSAEKFSEGARQTPGASTK